MGPVGQLLDIIGTPYFCDSIKTFGKPSYLDEMKKIVILKSSGEFELNLEYFRHHKEKIEYEWENGSPIVGSLFSKNLEKLQDKVPAFDLHDAKKIIKSIKYFFSYNFRNIKFFCLISCHIIR